MNHLINYNCPNFSKYYGIAQESKFCVIPLGLDLGEFIDDTHKKEYRTAFREKWGIESNTILVGIIGRLVPIKNHSLFLQVAKKALHRLPPHLSLKFGS